MQHLHYVSNNSQFVWWYFQPIIKCMSEFSSDLFARHLHNICKRLQEFLKTKYIKLELTYYTTYNLKIWNLMTSIYYIMHTLLYTINNYTVINLTILKYIYQNISKLKLKNFYRNTRHILMYYYLRYTFNLAASFSIMIIWCVILIVIYYIQFIYILSISISMFFNFYKLLIQSNTLKINSVTVSYGPQNLL